MSEQVRHWHYLPVSTRASLNKSDIDTTYPYQEGQVFPELNVGDSLQAFRPPRKLHEQEPGDPVDNEEHEETETKHYLLAVITAMKAHN